MSQSVKIRFSRGQGSLEFIASYGWAIMVVLVAGAALYSFGIIQIGGSNEELWSEGFSTLKLQEESSVIDDEGYGLFCSYTLNFFNGGPKIIVTEVNLTSYAPCETIYGDPVPPVVVLADHTESPVVGPGEFFTLHVPFSFSDPSTPCPENPAAPNCLNYGWDPPYNYEMNVSIKFRKFDSNLTHLDHGVIHGFLDVV
ncbi:MAG: hypothetical protein ABH950_05615 [Candidatus Altiarchaeota archaeon]